MPAGAEVPVDDVAVGALLLVRPGDKVPLDGLVTAGTSRLDHSMLTGESAPVKRGPGEEVSRSSLLHCLFLQFSGPHFLLQYSNFVEQAGKLPQKRCCDAPNPNSLGRRVVIKARIVTLSMFYWCSLEDCLNQGTARADMLSWHQPAQLFRLLPKQRSPHIQAAETV